MTPETIPTLIEAFNRLNQLDMELDPFTPIADVDAQGVTLRLGGEYEMEYHLITFTWDEFFTGALATLARERWATASQEAAQRAQEAQKQQQAREEAERKAAQAARQAAKQAKEARETEFRIRFPDAAAFLDAKS
jgi:hypothetical protein